MKQALAYTLKVWLTTVILAPVGVVFLQRNPPRPFINYLREYLWTILGDLVLFVPSIIVYLLVTVIVNKRNIRIALQKLVILGQAVVLFVSAWWLVFDFTMQTNVFQDPQEMAIVTVYLAVIGFSTCFYNLESVKTVPSIQSQV